MKYSHLSKSFRLKLFKLFLTVNWYHFHSGGTWKCASWKSFFTISLFYNAVHLRTSSGQTFSLLLFLPIAWEKLNLFQKHNLQMPVNNIVQCAALVAMAVQALNWCIRVNTGKYWHFQDLFYWWNVAFKMKAIIMQWKVFSC